jgi:hypothetical protein
MEVADMSLDPNFAAFLLSLIVLAVIISFFLAAIALAAIALGHPKKVDNAIEAIREIAKEALGKLKSK